MSMHLCFHCARDQGYSTTAETELLLESDYQLLKFMKHTRPDRIYDINSVFADPSTALYRDYVLNGAAAGSVEIDDYGRTNFLWVAGHQIGATYENGAILYPNDAVRIVLPFDEARVHAFPASSTGLAEAMCSKCGAPLLR